MISLRCSGSVSVEPRLSVCVALQGSGLMTPMDGALLVKGCHWPWILGLSVWKGLRIRMMSRPDWLVSLLMSSKISWDDLLVTNSSRTLPFTVEIRSDIAGGFFIYKIADIWHEQLFEIKYVLTNYIHTAPLV